jgi:hypothetical protein
VSPIVRGVTSRRTYRTPALYLSNICLVKLYPALCFPHATRADRSVAGARCCRTEIARHMSYYTLPGYLSCPTPKAQRWRLLNGLMRNRLSSALFDRCQSLYAVQSCHINSITTACRSISARGYGLWMVALSGGGGLRSTQNYILPSLAIWTAARERDRPRSRIRLCPR